MKIPMLDLVGQYKTIKAEIDEAIQKVLLSGAFINGPELKIFEDNMARFLGVKHAIGVASGSDALLLSLRALGIGAGDKVIVPSFTFFATAGAVNRLGAEPVFVDIDPNSYNLDLDQVEEFLSKYEIKAIIPVHLFGRPCDMNRLMNLAEKYNFKVVEDACQAINADICLGEGYQKAGTIGNTGCFSFFPSKNLGGFGDGGMIVTNDDELAEKIRVLRVHGSKPKYHHQTVGYNSRLDTLQAAVLNVKLKYLDEWTTKRIGVASKYNEEFNKLDMGNNVQTPEIVSGHVFHQYVIRTENRNQLQSYLKDKGIGTAVYYPKPLHLQECFGVLGYTRGDLPIAEKACDRVLALPIDPELKQEQIEYIVLTIDEFIKHS